jgi:hypothetical protein
MKIRKIWKNIEAKAKVPLTILIMGMLLVLSISFLAPDIVLAGNVHEDDFDDNDLGTDPAWTTSGSPVSDGTVYYGGSGYSLYITSSDSGTEKIYDSISVSDSAFTWYMRVNVNSTASGDVTQIGRVADDDGSDSICVLVGDSGDNYYWGVRLKDEGSANEYYSTTACVEDTWHNITVVGDGTRVKMYLGESTELINRTYTSGDTWDEMTLGEDSVNYRADNYIDDYSFWDSVN